MKCPCEECITRPICRSEGIILLMHKCHIMRKYITNEKEALKVASIIKPGWLYEGDGIEDKLYISTITSCIVKIAKDHS